MWVTEAELKQPVAVAVVVQRLLFVAFVSKMVVQVEHLFVVAEFGSVVEAVLELLVAEQQLVVAVTAFEYFEFASQQDFGIQSGFALVADQAQHLFGCQVADTVQLNLLVGLVVKNLFAPELKHSSQYRMKRIF